jgi:hypothetical protein
VNGPWLRRRSHGQRARWIGPGPTRDQVNAIEVWRPHEQHVVRYRDVDVFGLPALEVVERLRRSTEVVPHDDGFAARQLYPALWRPFAADERLPPGRRSRGDEGLDGEDRIVEAHPFRDESRNVFRAVPLGGNRIRLMHVDTGLFLFVSREVAADGFLSTAGDRIVEAHSHENEARNTWEVIPVGPEKFKFHNPDTNTFMFLSNDQKGDDFVIEAHLNATEVRNNFDIVFGP